MKCMHVCNERLSKGVRSSVSFSARPQKPTTEQGSGQFAKVIVPSVWNWNHPIRGWGRLAGGYWLRKVSSEPCLERASSCGMGHSGASPRCWRASGPYQDYYIQVSCMQQKVVGSLDGQYRARECDIEENCGDGVRTCATADVERSLFLMDVLYTSSMVSTESVRQ